LSESHKTCLITWLRPIIYLLYQVVVSDYHYIGVQCETLVAGIK